jgi:hypothetical protein
VGVGSLWPSKWKPEMCYPHSTLAGVIAGSLSMDLNQPKAGGHLFCCEFFLGFKIFKNPELEIITKSKEPPNSGVAQKQGHKQTKCKTCIY